MKISMTFELENEELETLANAKMVIAEEIKHDSIVHVYCEKFICSETMEELTVDQAMNRALEVFVKQGFIPPNAISCTYKLPEVEVPTGYYKKEIVPKVSTIMVKFN